MQKPTAREELEMAWSEVEVSTGHGIVKKQEIIDLIEKAREEGRNEERRILLEGMLETCDMTENEGGRLLVEHYKKLFELK